MSSPLDAAAIARLLQEEAQKPTGTRGPRVDPTADRTYTGWFRLNHHLCTPDCDHRTDPANPTATPITNTSGGISGFKPGNACWNPNCEDHTRDKTKDRSVNAVARVKDQYICRYCYLANYLL